MSINGPANTVAAIEIDMRDLLRAKRARHSDPSKEPGNDYSTLVSQMSGQSVHEIDHLIEGLQGVREKLNIDGDRLHRDIVEYTAFSQSIVELTKIVSDGMAFVNKSATAVATPKDVCLASAWQPLRALPACSREEKSRRGASGLRSSFGRQKGVTASG